LSNGNPHQAYTTQIALLTESSAHFSCMPGRSRHSPGRVQHDLLSQTATCRVDLVADQVDVPVKAASAGAFWEALGSLGSNSALGRISTFVYLIVERHKVDSRRVFSVWGEV